jgi:hypothetical protein
MLTDAQRTDVRRYMGHPVLNAGEPDTVYATAYSRATFPVSLTVRLDNLTATEQVVLTNTFLVTLAILEAAIPSAGDGAHRRDRAALVAVRPLAPRDVRLPRLLAWSCLGRRQRRGLLRAVLTWPKCSRSPPASRTTPATCWP